ncbi:MAG TPA: glycosyltransferase [Solirubrobacteraceae bacterium]|nr:glycosyltransferase [Solirubrobacteraceae bacterium]
MRGARRLRRPKPGVNLVGYLNHVVGLGESARQFAGALRAAGVPHACAAVDLGDHVPPLPGAEVAWLGEAELPFEVTVLWVNPDRFGLDVEPAELPGRRLIGRWAWELAVLPDSWRAVAGGFSEIWTASAFVRDAVQKGVAVPVRVMPMAVSVPPVEPLDRRRWNVDPGHTLFLYLFDYHSTPARKNPLGLIDAFAAAFPDGSAATLLIKTINANHGGAAAAEIDAAAAHHSGIQVIDAPLSGPERLSLLAGCDCYVSLHRSEGFGMTIAEAMGYGRPVIATDHGGSSEYLTEKTGYPVPCQLVEVGLTNHIYPADGVWAEPALETAARLMRELTAHPRDAGARARRAAKLIAKRYAPLRVGREAQRQLLRGSEV